MRIEPYDTHQLDPVIRLSLRAWTPVFDSIQKVMDAEIYQHFHPDWRVKELHAVVASRLRRQMDDFSFSSETTLSSSI